MIFEVNRLAMLAAAKDAAQVASPMGRLASAGDAVSVLSGVLIEYNEDTSDVYLTATNYEMSIQLKITASVAESGAMLVNPSLLVGMLTLLPSEFVNFSASNSETLTVSCGRCVYEVSCMHANHYPKPVMPFPEETIKLSGICSLAKRTVFAVSKDNNRPALQCVNVSYA